MKEIWKDLISLRIVAVIAVALLSIAACHSPSEFPSVPPTPAGFTACTGHGNSHFDLVNNNYPLWYAFWWESADSNRATLIVGINPNYIDTLYSGQDTSRTWRIVENDTTVPNSFAYVLVTSDSVIEGTFATSYYLKKLK